MSSAKTKVDQIVKFVNAMYHPYKTKVVDIKIGERKVYTIGFYFKDISDEYLSDFTVTDVKRNNLFLLAKKKKEYNLTKEIRTYVENYLGIKTTGLQGTEDFKQHEDHGITIVTQSDK
jgi:hypothetical protein